MTESTAATNATARIADFVRDTGWQDLPNDVRREGLRSFYNILACTIGGARHEAVDITWRALAPFAGAPATTVIGRGMRTDALTAALVNTFSSSVNTFDDTHAEAIVHPAGPIMASVLAVAEQRKITGTELLAAFTLGIEVVCRLSKAVSVPPAKGTIAWSQTGIASGAGAALAAGKLLGLDVARMRQALGIAAAFASGLRAPHGTMCTAMMPAHAAQTGLRAAFLAAAGFTCTETVIEHRYGFAQCFAETANLEALTGRLGAHYEALGNTYKPFPCGIVIHPLIDAALQLRAEHRLNPADIKRIDVDVSAGAIALCDRRHPANELEGQVSLYQWVAAAFLRGKAGVPEGTDAAIADPAIRAMRDIISPTVKPDIALDACDMRVTMANGQMLSKRIVHCIGSRDRPMTDSELEAKFRGLAEPHMAAKRMDTVSDLTWRLDKLEDVRELIEAVA